jgi:hypothetical protein
MKKQEFISDLNQVFYFNYFIIKLNTLSFKLLFNYFLDLYLYLPIQITF